MSLMKHRPVQMGSLSRGAEEASTRSGAGFSSRRSGAGFKPFHRILCDLSPLETVAAR